jgi:hypothetical protein
LFSYKEYYSEDLYLIPIGEMASLMFPYPKTLLVSENQK